MANSEFNGMSVKQLNEMIDAQKAEGKRVSPALYKARKAAQVVLDAKRAARQARKAGEPSAPRVSVYQPIADELAKHEGEQEVQLTIPSMTELIGREFPASATKYFEWWSGSKSNVPAWRRAGWHPYPRLKAEPQAVIFRPEPEAQAS